MLCPLHSVPLSSVGSFLQSTKKTDPLESDITSCLLVEGFEDTEVNGAENGMTRAVGSGVSAAVPSRSP